jgi:hypothetical protein
MYGQWFETPVITTAADGSATGYTPIASGKVLAVQYVKTNYVDGMDVAVTVESTSEPVLTLTDCNAAVMKYPRVGIQDEAGADALFAAAGTKQREAVCIANDRLKVVIAQGGDTKTGKFRFLIGG